MGIGIASNDIREFVLNEDDVIDIVKKNISKCKEIKNFELIVIELHELANESFLERGSMLMIFQLLLL